MDPSSQNVCSSRGQCTAPNQCKCNPGFYGDECERFACFSIDKDNSTVCHSSGECKAPDQCACSEGFTGFGCEHFMCGNVDKDNMGVCSFNGKCIEPDHCECTEGYYGTNCEMFTCASIAKDDSKVCSSHGRCFALDKCSCDVGYRGDLCDDFFCSSISHKNEKVCSSHGKCISPNNCNCTQGYYGSMCESFTCGGVDSKDVTVCGKHGKCMSLNRCECSIGFEGDVCEKLQAVTSMNFTKVSFDSFVVVWTSSVVEGVTYHVKLLDSKDVSKSFTTLDTTMTFSELTEKSMYSVSVAVEKDGVKSIDVSRTVFTWAAPVEPVKVGSSVPLVIPLAVSTTIPTASRIRVNLPSSYKIDSARRTVGTFTLSDGVQEYSLSDFQVQGNVQSAVVDQDIPAGNYFIHTRVIAQSASNSVMGSVSMVDNHQNVVELATFSVPQIGGPVAPSTSASIQPGQSNTQPQASNGNSQQPGQSNAQPQASNGNPMTLASSTPTMKEDRTFYHLFFLFFLLPFIAVAVITPIVVFIVMKKSKKAVEVFGTEMKAATV